MIPEQKNDLQQPQVPPAKTDTPSQTFILKNPSSVGSKEALLSFDGTTCYTAGSDPSLTVIATVVGTSENAPLPAPRDGLPQQHHETLYMNRTMEPDQEDDDEKDANEDNQNEEPDTKTMERMSLLGRPGSQDGQLTVETNSVFDGKKSDADPLVASLNTPVDAERLGRSASARPPPSAVPSTAAPTVTPVHLENFFSLEEIEDGDSGGNNDDEDWDIDIEDDDDKKKKEVEEDETEEDEPTCLSNFKDLPRWVRFLILEFSGSILLMVPAATLMIMDPGYMPDLTTFDYRKLTVDENQLESLHQLVRFSMWLSVSWFALVFWWFFLSALPRLLTQFVKWLYGQCSVTFQSRLDYIHFIHPFLVFACWMSSSVILYTIIFAQWQIVQSWFTGFRILCVILIFSLCLVFQRLLVQMIAVRFHKLVYEERIKESKKAIKILDRLRKSIKTVGITDIFDLAGEIQKTVIDPLSAGIKKVTSGGDGAGGDGQRSSMSGDSPTKKKKTVFLMDVHHANHRPHHHHHPSQSTQDVLVAIPTCTTTDELEVKKDPSQNLGASWSQWYRNTSKADDSQNADVIGMKQMGKSASPVSDSDTSTQPLEQKSDEGPRRRSRWGSNTKLAADTTDTKAQNDRDKPRYSTGGSTKHRKPPTRSNTEMSDSRTTAGAVKIGGSSYHNKVKSTQVLDESHALALAKKLFYALLKYSADEKSKEITIEAFRPFFPTPKSCQQAFRIFDKDSNGSITKKEMKSAILHVYRERRNLFKSLRDLSEALGRLNLILYGFSGFLTAFLSLPVYGIELSAVLPFTSILVALSFIFGSATRTTFECIIFLFVTHPYDTGDRIIIDGSAYIVDEVNLLTTVLVRSDGQRIYAPNSILASKLIHNIRRSGDQSEQITFELDFATPEATLRQLQEKMAAFLSSQPRDFNQNCSINLSEMDAQTGRLKCTTTLSYKGNWQDSGKRWMRRTNYMWALKRAMEELSLQPKHLSTTEVVFKEPVPTYAITNGGKSSPHGSTAGGGLFP